MLRTTSLAVLALLAAAPALAQPAADVPIERVILFTSGVGYFEHGGRVSGASEVTLQFEEDALNDVLKSLLVEDRAGRVRGVTFPTQAPIAETLRSFEIDLSNGGGIADILRQARGAVVTIDGRVTGTVIAVTQEARAVGDGVATVPVVALATGGGLRAVRLDTAERVRFEDAALQAELDGALAALADASSGERRPVRIQFEGAGARRVRLGYVIGAPVWKTSYRLELPDDGREGQLQGWALVENTTEADWDGVDLTLVSGRPVSFEVDLRTPRTIQRPFVELPGLAPVGPISYEAGVRRRTVARLQGGAVSDDASGALNVRAGRSEDVAYYADGEQVALAPPPPPPAAPLAAFDGVATLAETGDFGELFAYRLGDVDLPRRAAAMLPIVTQDVSAEKLSVWSRSAPGRHPMRAVRLVNTTGLALRGGPVTVLDEGYAGDALLPDLPAGDERLLSFAVDQAVLVDPFQPANAPTVLESARLADGVLVLRRQGLTVSGYRLENRGERDREVLVEHPLVRGSDLVQPARAEETTPTAYRFRVALPAGAQDSLIVREARTLDERIALSTLSADQIARYARADGDVPEAVRRALRDAVAARRALAETERQIATLQRERREIEREQERIRGNLQSIDNASAYGRRLLTKLDEQETELEEIDTQIERLEEQAEAERRALLVTAR